MNEVDPDIAAAAEKIKAFGGRAEKEFVTKFLLLNDKQYLDTLVALITEKYKNAPSEARLDEIGKNVDLVWSTAWGSIAQLKDGRALALRSDGFETFASLAAFHKKNPGNSGTWREVTDIEGRRKFFEAAETALAQV